jgi:hypothetical protein
MRFVVMSMFVLTAWWGFGCDTDGASDCSQADVPARQVPDPDCGSLVPDDTVIPSCLECDVVGAECHVADCSSCDCPDGGPCPEPDVTCGEPDVTCPDPDVSCPELDAVTCPDLPPEPDEYDPPVMSELVELNKELFGKLKPDVPEENLLTFDFVLSDDNLPEVENEAGPCEGVCPVVYIEDIELGEVLRKPELDNLPENLLGFTYEYIVDEADWGWNGEFAAKIEIVWADAWGNEMEEFAAEPFFDFEIPTPAGCSLIPEVATMNSVIAYQVMVSEPLAEAPILTVDAEFPIFQEAPEVTGMGHVYTWKTAAFELTDGAFSVSAELLDLAGNDSDGFVCWEEGIVDTQAPVVIEVQIEVDGGAVDPASTPLNAGRELTVQFQTTGTALEPVVKLGDQQMVQVENLDLGEGTMMWTFSRVLDGSEGEGIQHILISGMDEAGNAFTFSYQDSPIMLDFTPPVCQCKTTPVVAILGDTITLTVSTSETLAELPELESSLIFEAPEPDLFATVFEFQHVVTEMDNQGPWTYQVNLTDPAGNSTMGGVCSGGGEIDSMPPMLTDGMLSTAPEVMNNNGEEVLAAGPDGLLLAVFSVAEDSGQATPPLVYLDIPGAPVQFVETGSIEMEPGLWQYEYELTVDPFAMWGMEGSWPVKVIVEDQAGNVAVEDVLGDILVTIDFSPPEATCMLIPDSSQVYGPKEKITLVVVPFEELMFTSLPELTVQVDPALPGTLFEYVPGTEYQFAVTVPMGIETFDFTLFVSLTDIVGNTTPWGLTACKGGILSGTISGGM